VCVSRPRAGAGSYIELGEARIGPGRAVGAASSERLDARWDLAWTAPEPALHHLPAEWMYRASFPRTKLLTEAPGASFSGTVRAGDREIALDAWPGMVGHNWGAEHARRAIWIHGAGFSGHERTWLDLGIGRVGLGPLTTPWIANGAISIDGERHRLGGLGQIRGTHIEETPERCDFRLAGQGVALDGTVGAPRERFVGWIYAQPDGGERQTVNCSIADMRVTVHRPGTPPLTLALDAAAAYELQMGERYPPIPVQPFADG
jgi:hypothetical protein